MKPGIVVKVLMNITASECNDGVVVPDGYRYSSCISSSQGNTLIMISKHTMRILDRAVMLKTEISLVV